MAKYAAVAHIYWELPFAFRLPPHVFICWEPEEGSALFDPKPAVGALRTPTAPRPNQGAHFPGVAAQADQHPKNPTHHPNTMNSG